MTPNKPKVGDKLWALPIGNNARGRKELKLEEAEVSKVGRKYFYVKVHGRWGEYKFYLDSWAEANESCMVSYCLYSSPQEWEDEKERRHIHGDISHAFNYGGSGCLSLEELRSISAIIKKAQERKNGR